MTNGVSLEAIEKIEWPWSLDTRNAHVVINTTPRAAWRRSGVANRLAAVLIAGFSCAATAEAQVVDQPPVAPYVLTPKRMAASCSAIVGLIGAIIGGLALARSRARIGPGHGRRGATAALVTGAMAFVGGGVVAATATGGLGTGNGIAGGVVAIALGLIATSLGGLVVARSRRVT